MSLPIRASSPVHYPTATPLPLLVRLAPILASLLLGVLILPSFFPSPWTPSSLSSSSSSPHLFLRPPPPPVLPPSSHVPPVSGCRSTPLTSLEPRENGAIVLLLRESDLASLLPTLENFEARFNGVFRYPYVMISDPEAGALSSEFMEKVRKTLPEGAVTEYAVVPEEHWSIPSWLDKADVRRGFEEQEKRGVQYAGREGYHHMCRWFSGLWVRSEALSKYNWFWRLEPGVRFYCDITYDPLRFLALHNKVYGFTISVVENQNTIPTLFDTVETYLDERGYSPARKELDPALRGFLTRRNRMGKEEFTGCHFWTNFEIGDLRFFRSKEYQAFFNALDKRGGFYHERWGDAPVRALGLGIFAKLSQIHHFSDLAYQHDYFLSCPSSSTSRIPQTGSDTLLTLQHRSGKGLVSAKETVGCRCECPKAGELQGRKEGEEVVDMGMDWKYSCLEQWEAAVRKSEGRK